MREININRLQHTDISGKIVLVRFDHNVVKKGKIEDPFRIDQTIATLFYIYVHGGKPIMMTHAARPRDKKTGNITISDSTSIKPVVDYLKAKLNLDLVVPELQSDNDRGYRHCRPQLQHLVEQLKNGRFDGIYLPNTRWFAGEEAKGEEAEALAEDLASLADFYVNDAFGSWQAHTSTYHVAQKLPSFAGLLMQKELDHLNLLYKPERPFTAVVAGSKFDTKIEPLSSLLKTCDHLVLGGVMYNAYLCAKYGVKIEGVGEDDIAVAKNFVDLAEQYPGRVVELPLIIESDTLDGKIDGQFRTIDVRTFKPGQSYNYILDADPAAFYQPEIAHIFAEAKTIFVNAVMGFTPNFFEGTATMNRLIAANTTAHKLFGGGDTLQDMRKFTPEVYLATQMDDNYYLFTGGGAVLNAIQAGTPEQMLPIQMLLKK